MKEAYWGYWLVILGIFVMSIMIMTQTLTTTNTSDYYTLKETTEAAMLDAIDYGYYRIYGEIRMNKEVFVANFLRRFAQDARNGSTYKVDFYDLYESPPKVSVKISNTNISFTVANESADFDVVNRMDAVLVADLSSAGVSTTCPYYSHP